VHAASAHVGVIRRARLVVVGNAAAGKSALVRALLSNEKQIGSSSSSSSASSATSASSAASAASASQARCCLPIVFVREITR
jgi:GTPase SAR1 family protein